MWVSGIFWVNWSLQLANCDAVYTYMYIFADINSDFYNHRNAYESLWIHEAIRADTRRRQRFTNTLLFLSSTFSVHNSACFSHSSVLLLLLQNVLCLRFFLNKHVRLVLVLGALASSSIKIRLLTISHTMRNWHICKVYLCVHILFDQLKMCGSPAYLKHEIFSFVFVSCYSVECATW